MANLDQQRQAEHAGRSAEIASVLALGGRANNLKGVENPDVVWGRTTGEGVWLPTKDGHRIRLALDAADACGHTLSAGVRVFPGVASDTDMVAVTAFDGIALLAVLHSPVAPPQFWYSISLPGDLILDAMPSGGFDVVHQYYGATVARINRPWASDSAYRPLAVDYVHGESTSLALEMNAADASYPLVIGIIYRYCL
ncbi:MAG TPA: hypothetical protein VFM01_10200 [Nakamurella sp.]|nr:hypothetical protein [Nakamurella sp.]